MLPDDVPIGTLALNQSDSKVWKHNAEGQWTLITELKGPQGVQGPQGLKGDTGEQGPQGPQGSAGTPGTSVPIKYIVATTGALPAPEIGASALVKTDSGYDLYICAENDSGTLIWQNLGAFMAGTAVTTSGVVQPVFDADTKLDKITTTDTIPRMYVINRDGTGSTIYLTDYVRAGAIPFREGSTGNIYAETVNADTQSKVLTNVEYVKNNFVPKLKTASSYYRIFVQSPNGDLSAERYVSSPLPSTIMYRDPNGCSQTTTPVKSNDIANKKYVDDAVSVQHQAKLSIAGNMAGWGNGFIFDVNSTIIPQLSINNYECEYVSLFAYPNTYSANDVNCVQLMVKVKYNPQDGGYSITEVNAISDY